VRERKSGRKRKCGGGRGKVREKEKKEIKEERNG
jgi:hypothetical protein